MTGRRDGPKHNMPGGRPASYKPEYAERAHKLALLGLTDRQIAGVIGVAEATLNKWKLEHPEFTESLNEGKHSADARVAKSLYERALGYSHPEDKIFCSRDGDVTKVRTTKHYPPDTVACIFWLKNRQKDQWRDKQEHDIRTPDGIKTDVGFNLKSLSAEELGQFNTLLAKACSDSGDSEAGAEQD